MTTGIHPYVADLMRCVVRAFYRDEFIVVMDVLTQEAFVREDRLDKLFPPFGARQVGSILRALEAEFLVCSEEVIERARRKRDREREEAFQIAKVEAELKRMREKARRAGEIAKIRERLGDQAAAEIEKLQEADDEANNASSRETTIRTRCWYINPRYAVDAVRYRMHIMRQFLREQETGTTRLKMYECPSCGYEATATEAHQLMAKSALQQSQQAAANPITVMRATNSNGPSFPCPNPVCAGRMRKKDMRQSRQQRSSAVDRFDSLLSQFSSIEQLLRQLETVKLGANRPSDHVHEKRVTLRGPQHEAVGPRTGNGTSGNGTNGVGEFNAGVYGLAQQNVEVQLDEQEDSSLHLATSFKRDREGNIVGGSAAQASNEDHDGVDLNALPEFLRRSAFTGKDTQTMGFKKTHSNEGLPETRQLTAATNAAVDAETMLNLLAADMGAKSADDGNKQNNSQDGNNASKPQDIPAAEQQIWAALLGSVESLGADTTESKPIDSQVPSDSMQVEDESEDEWESEDEETYDAAATAAASKLQVTVEGVQKPLLEITSADTSKMTASEYEAYASALQAWAEECK